MGKSGQLSLLTLQGLTRLRLLANHPVLAHPDYKEDSGKFEQVMMRLETLRAEGHKVLIFSSFVRHLKLLANFLDKESRLMPGSPDLPRLWIGKRK
jgi:SNF2 family DNA or RNA helicase